MGRDCAVSELFIVGCGDVDAYRDRKPLNQQNRVCKKSDCGQVAFMQSNVILDWTSNHNPETQKKIYLYDVVAVSQSGSGVQIKFLSNATQRDDF